MLPDGWVKTTVGKSCAIRNTLRFPLNATDRANMRGEYPYFGPTGKLDAIDHYRIDEPFALIGEDGDHFLKFRDRPMTLYFEGKANVNNHAHIIGNSKDCLAKWFYYCFMHKDLTATLSRQGVGRYKLTRSGLEQLELVLPPKQEQAAIVEVLSTWDQAIATTERLLANAGAQQKALTSQLFIHGRHSSMTTHGWKFVDFDQIFERVTRRNSTANSNVLTISGTRGLVSQRDYFNKSVASENLTGYTLLERGEFAYNKSYSAGYPMGAIKPLTRYDQGVVSSLYICFRLRDGAEADADFFRHYFEEGMLNEGLSGIAQEGARNHGLLNVGVSDFFKLRLHIPDVTEQRRIADILNMAEQKEQLITAQLDKLRDEKKALMSQLLTGKRRVRLPADEAAHA
ncbi:restriction endonuclease subunit S [Xanthomonas campestris pv. incanae]|uniref:restriction endonuclease subunit S n=1 Tax=Xanthomonas campestris TaxID=339 RepID=UPI0023680521|nr:restriction endonuclease subunit S [Xanthomonas campestris]WDK26807.1 restriction endonuclease subunit S [Xanthomonas campestris pv. incanae]